MLLGRVARFVIRLDRLRCGRKHREVPPADDFGRGHGYVSRDGNLDEGRRVRVERSPDARADVVRRLHFGCNPETEGLRERDRVDGVGPPIASVMIELRPDLSSYKVVLAVADRYIAGV